MSTSRICSIGRSTAISSMATALFVLSLAAHPVAAQEVAKVKAKVSAGTKSAIKAPAVPALVSAPALPEKITSTEGITEYRLANGLKVLLFPDNSKPTITVNVTYLVGSRHESYGETGMAHLLEHLLFKGTPKNPDIPEQFSKRGANYNGTTNFDRTNYYELVQASDENLQWTIELEADRMVNSNIARKDLDSEMSVVRNEYERGENNPAGVLFKRMQSIAFDWHNYQNAPIGNRSDIENVKIENLQAFYRQYYQPDNAVLLIAGKFDESTALKLVADAFGKIPKPTRVLPKLWTVEPEQDGERSFTVRRSGNIQLVLVSYKVPAVLHPDANAMTFVAQILGNTPNGRLHKLLVESGKAAGVGANGATTVDPGLMSFIAAVKEGENLDDVQKMIVDLVENFAQNPPSEEEMNRVRVAIEKSFDQVMSSPEALTVALSEAIANGDWRVLFHARELVKKITSADVARVAKTYFRRDNRTSGQFLPTKDPQRADIPVAPAVVDVMKDFKAVRTMTAGETFDPAPANIDARTKRYTLANGMKVALLVKKTRGDTVNVAINAEYGDETSLFGRSGAIGFAGPMMMRGTNMYTRAQLADERDKLKFSGNVSLGNAAFRTTRANLAASLELAVHTMKEATFPEAELVQLRKQALVGLESTKGDPDALAGEALGRHFNRFPPGHPRYAPTREESMAEIKSVTLDDIKRAHRDFLGFSNAQIAVVGDFDEADMRVLLDKLFGNWKSPLPYQRILDPFVVIAPINKTIETPDKENAVFRAQMLIELQQNEADFAPLVLANYMFGSSAAGLDSRIMKRIRAKEGLSYGANTSLSVSDRNRRGSFGASATAAPQNIAQLEKFFREELDRARKDGFTAEELAKAKSGLLTSRNQNRAQEGFLANSWVSLMDRDKTFAESAEMDAKLSRATLEEANAAFRKYIDPDKLTIIKAGDFAKVAGAAK